MSESAFLQPAGGVAYRPLSAVRARFPGSRANATLHLSTLIRWCTRGIRMPDGSRVRLRAVRAGSRWLTTDPWVDEFLAALTAAHTDTSPVPPARSPARRDRESDRAIQTLAQEFGFRTGGTPRPRS